jgi:hypothetical protein
MVLVNIIAQEMANLFAYSGPACSPIAELGTNAEVGTFGFDESIALFIEQFGTLKAAYERTRAHLIAGRRSSLLPRGLMPSSGDGGHRGVTCAAPEFGLFATCPTLTRFGEPNQSN